MQFAVAFPGLCVFLGTLVALLGTSPLVYGQWDPIASSGTKASLRGVHNTAGGAVLRSTDHGSSWRLCAVPPDAGKLDFRGVWGFSKSRAIVMSSGPGDASRLYKTSDGGRSWQLLLKNPDPAGFWDAVAFRKQAGVLLGDPVDGSFVVYKTNDSGRHWKKEKSAALTANPQGEGAFAASNSALVIRPDGKVVLFGTGGLGGARIFRSDSKNSNGWTTTSLPWKGKSESAGIFSLAFRDAKHGVAVGGDYKNPANREGTAAFTSDGGMSWQSAAVPPNGYRSSVNWDGNRQAWIAVGSNGSDISRDDGRTWKRLDGADWNALGAPWAVGSNGRIARLNLQR